MYICIYTHAYIHTYIHTYEPGSQSTNTARIHIYYIHDTNIPGPQPTNRARTSEETIPLGSPLTTTVSALSGTPPPPPPPHPSPGLVLEEECEVWELVERVGAGEEEERCVCVERVESELSGNMISRLFAWDTWRGVVDPRSLSVPFFFSARRHAVFVSKTTNPTHLLPCSPPPPPNRPPPLPLDAPSSLLSSAWTTHSSWMGLFFFQFFFGVWRLFISLHWRYIILNKK
jgi:hypothetical protein